jgi:CheY-like chemotaxis protein
VLENHGYKVLEACDGADALRLCEAHAGRIDLMVSDVIMPNLSGCRLAERLKTLQPGLRILFLSGYTHEAIAHHGVLDLQGELLQKPFLPDTLACKVREVLDA